MKFLKKNEIFGTKKGNSWKKNKKFFGKINE